MRSPEELIGALRAARQRHYEGRSARDAAVAKEMGRQHNAGQSWSAAEKLATVSPAVREADRAAAAALQETEELTWTLKFALARMQQVDSADGVA